MERSGKVALHDLLLHEATAKDADLVQRLLCGSTIRQKRIGVIAGSLELGLMVLEALPHERTGRGVRRTELVISGNLG